jgi:hypothetical protein
MAVMHAFQVGNLVRFQFGPKKVNGVVKEDRGRIGKGGRQLYLIQFSLEAPQQSIIELPADELELVPDTVSRR